MKQIGYGSATILVSDAAASAVLHYAAILAQTGGGDVVDIPTSDDDGVAANATVVLGPGIPVMATNAPDDVLESEDQDFVDELTGRVAVALAVFRWDVRSAGKVAPGRR
nr:hypothetical protein N8D75_17505 [Curtobacterium flaccumfaciens]